MKRIIADAGPLIIFAKSEKIWIIKALARDVVITNTVLMECTSDANKPGATAILQAVRNEIISVVNDPEISPEIDSIPLDAGEKATIAYAMAVDEVRVILIDELSGQKVASKLGLQIIGSSGLLVAAKKKGVIGSVAIILREWQDLGYRLNEELVRRVLVLAGES